MTMRGLLLSLLAVAAALPAMAQPAGEGLYADNCAACHMPTGLGVKGAFPALAGNKLVTGSPAVLTTTVLNGRGGMPAFRDELSDESLAAVLTYLRSSWGNKAAPLTPQTVAGVRADVSGAPKPKDLQAH